MQQLKEMDMTTEREDRNPNLEPKLESKDAV